MKKKDRELIFNKYDGRCAYCGCVLEKGWHVDELLPVHRNYKNIPAGWFHKASGERKKPEIKASGNPEYEYRESRTVLDGCLYPDRFNLKNQMPACASCNINKHSGSLEDFRELIQGFMKHLNGVNTQYKIAKRYGLVQETIKPVVFYFETLQHSLPIAPPRKRISKEDRDGIVSEFTKLLQESPPYVKPPEKTKP